MNQLAVLNRIAGASQANLGLDELLHVIHREIVATLPCDEFFIVPYDPMTDELDCRIQIDEDLCPSSGVGTALSPRVVRQTSESILEIAGWQTS